MAKKYVSDQSLIYLIKLIKDDLDKRIPKSDICKELSTAVAGQVPDATQVKALSDQLGALNTKLDGYPTAEDLQGIKDSIDGLGETTLGDIADKVNELPDITSLQQLVEQLTQITEVIEKVGQITDVTDLMTKTDYDTDKDGKVNSAVHADTADKATNADQLGGVPAAKYVQVSDDGLIDSAKLPSFVDDVVEGYYFEGKFYQEETHENEITGETGKIYVDITNEGSPVSYRFGGTAYVAIVSSDLVEITNSEIDGYWNPPAEEPAA